MDVGRTRCRPPAGLAELVRARDQVCVFPTCQTPAEWYDIDHLTAWSQGGSTSLDNLVTLCEAHHRLKHTPGWTLTRDETSRVLSYPQQDRLPVPLRRHHHPPAPQSRAPPAPRPSSIAPKDLSKQISPDILNRLNRAVDRALDDQVHEHTGLGTNANGSGRAWLGTRGPQPGQRAGDYEVVPYPQAAHTLGLAPLIDAAPPF